MNKILTPFGEMLATVTSEKNGNVVKIQYRGIDHFYRAEGEESISDAISVAAQKVMQQLTPKWAK